MATEIKWTDRAINNLNRIHNFIALDSPIYAKRFTISLVTSTENLLSKQPLSGRQLPEFINTPVSYLREVIYKGYRVIYNPSNFPTSVSVVAIINGRQDVWQNIKTDWIL
jgi:toxin ParE1/3/4